MTMSININADDWSIIDGEFIDYREEGNGH